ncbi:MAG: SgcJ/EcaC family oxidoreductase [Patescibacteria group bacterium]|jgi:uncharacterized protein (TIGR02246 family)
MNEVKTIINPEQETMEQIAKENFSKWNDQLLSGKAEKVASLYTEKNTFLPTVSGDFKRGKDGAKEYFKHFLEKNPEGEIIEGKVDVISADCYVHSGKYNFTVDAEEGRAVVEAEFSYVWKKNEAGEWEVDHHHSSARNDEKKFELENGFRLDVKLSGNPEEDNEQAYFAKYFSENNIGVISEDAVQKLSDNSYLHSGMYNLSDGREARFTITWKKDDSGEWEIIQHHLSMRPSHE